MRRIMVVMGVLAVLVTTPLLAKGGRDPAMSRQELRQAINTMPDFHFNPKTNEVRISERNVAGPNPNPFYDHYTTVAQFVGGEQALLEAFVAYMVKEEFKFNRKGFALAWNQSGMRQLVAQADTETTLFNVDTVGLPIDKYLTYSWMNALESKTSARMLHCGTCPPGGPDPGHYCQCVEGCWDPGKSCNVTSVPMPKDK